jgi:hypothetical protein
MTLGIAGLAIGYLMIILLLINTLFFTPPAWLIKLILCFIVTGYSLLLYTHIPEQLGWPVAEKPPERFRLLGSYIQEPNKTMGMEGSIFLWISDLQNGVGAVTPRAYQFPYSNQLHQAVENAIIKTRKGLPQFGEITYPKMVVSRLKKTNDIIGLGNITLEFHDLPDPLFPER